MVWDRLLGCFGDSLLRKFGATPPAEWKAAIVALNDVQLERGMRRLLFGWKGGPPNLPDFMRLCRTVGGDDFDEGQHDLPRLPTGPDPWDDKPWEKAGNRYLLGYLAKQLGQDPKRYGRPASYMAMRMSEEDLRKRGLHRKLLDASEDFIANVNTLVRAKNAWVEDMKDLAANNRGEVDPATQKAVWADYFGRAEAEILSRRDAA